MGRSVVVALLVAVATAGCGGAAPEAASPAGEAAASVAPTERRFAPATTVAPQAVPSGTASDPSAPQARQVKPGAVGAGEAVRPSELVLPSGAVAQVDPAGLYPDGALKVPDLPSRVGWWTGGALAGDPYGGLVIAGHVDSRTYGLGALATMSAANAGDRLIVRGRTAEGGRRSVTYRVDGVQTVPQAELSARTAAFSQQVPHRLVVITCGGPFDRTTHHYRDNVVVTASPVAPVR